ncbi:MAG: lipoprotein [Erysipelotrichaceae bacterium]|nr:lipoprotein [Erysipelotrichaceae bacterium]
MKKIIYLLFILLLLSGCSKSLNKVDIETYEVDMSAYAGISYNDHMFKGTTVKELEKVMNEKGSGVFILSRVNCDHCQMVMQYLNDVAKELDVTVYYIDAISKEYPILHTENYDILYNILYDYLNEGGEGKEIMTPHLITVVNGKIISSKIGTTWSGSNYDENDVRELKNLYKKMLTQFSN